MKKSLNFKYLIINLAFSLVCLLPNNARADCEPTPSNRSTCDSTTNLHYPSKLPPNYYGNAQTDSFNCALNGTTQLTMDQINERNDFIPPSLNNRFYVRLGGNAAAEGVIMADNKAEANNTATGAIGLLSDDQHKTASNNFEIAFGYAWKDFALDLEWLALTSVTFNSSIINITPSFSFSSTIKGDAILTNWYWTFKDLYNVKLYGIFSLGMSHNQSTTSIESGPSNFMNRYYPAGGLGVGVRFNVISSLFIDIAGRALYLGKVRMSATNGDNFVDVNAARSWLGASFRLMWLI